MTGLTPLQPDEPACVLCGRPADGACALCHAHLCAGCASLVRGLTRPLAVCPTCARKTPRAGRGLLSWLWLPAVLVVAVVLLVLLVR